MGHVLLDEHIREDAGILDRRRNDEHRPALPMAAQRLVQGGGVLVLRRREVAVGQIATLQAPVRRHDDHALAVDARKLAMRIGERAAHTAHIGEHQEEVLIGDRGDRALLLGKRQMLLLFDGLVHAAAQLHARQAAADAVVQQDDLALVGNHVLLLNVEQGPRPQGQLDMAVEFEHAVGEEVVDAEIALGVGHARVGEPNRFVFNFEIAALFEG